MPLANKEVSISLEKKSLICQAGDKSSEAHQQPRRPKETHRRRSLTRRCLTRTSRRVVRAFRGASSIAFLHPSSSQGRFRVLFRERGSKDVFADCVGKFRTIIAAVAGSCDCVSTGDLGVGEPVGEFRTNVAAVAGSFSPRDPCASFLVSHYRFLSPSLVCDALRNASASPRTTPRPLDGPQNGKLVDSSMAGWGDGGWVPGVWLLVMVLPY